MKKIFKDVVSVTLVAAMAVSGVTFTTSVKAAVTVESWQNNAVVLPAEGTLVGAGYIPVEFDNSLEGYTYTVLLDGKEVYWDGKNIVKTELGDTKSSSSAVKTFTSEDLGKTEVYTTEVKKHQITVKATDGKNEIVSAPRTFYVSKKGLALGTDMTDKIQLKKLNCSWYYSWGTEACNNHVDEGVEHVPMMWGNGDDVIEAMGNLSTKSNYILGFNEPDLEAQANMTLFSDAVAVWKQYITPLDMRKVSPAPSHPFGSSPWLDYFLNGHYISLDNFENDGSWGIYEDFEDEDSKTWVEGVGDDVDAVTLHYYRNVLDVQGLKDAVKTLWDKYHKPVWVTELSLFGMKSNPDFDFSYENLDRRRMVEQYAADCVKALDEIPYVERYCWFSYDIDSTNDIDKFDGSGGTCMFEYATGKYTKLGKIYSDLGNPVGYKAESIAAEEMYEPSEWYQYTPAVEETTTPSGDNAVATTAAQPQTTKAPETTAQPQTTKAPETTVATVKVGSTKVSKVSRTKDKKKIKLTIKKVSGATGYEIKYSTNKKFKKAKVVSTKKVKYTLKKLKEKKAYYISVRAYKTVSGKKNYGAWSKAKKVK